MCPKGVSGKLCEIGCPNGFFGEDCDKKCKCERSVKCDQVLGTCKCSRGFWGKKCEYKCPKWSYGENCKKKCLPRCNEKGSAGCSAKTGKCLCKEGWTGKKCWKKCKKGTRMIKMNIFPKSLIERVLYHFLILVFSVKTVDTLAHPSVLKPAIINSDTVKNQNVQKASQTSQNAIFLAHLENTEETVKTHVPTIAKQINVPLNLENAFVQPDFTVKHVKLLAGSENTVKTVKNLVNAIKITPKLAIKKPEFVIVMQVLWVVYAGENVIKIIMEKIACSNVNVEMASVIELLENVNAPVDFLVKIVQKNVLTLLLVKTV